MQDHCCRFFAARGSGSLFLSCDASTKKPIQCSRAAAMTETHVDGRIRGGSRPEQMMGREFVVSPSAIFASRLSVCLRCVVVHTWLIRVILTLERETRFFSSSSAALSILPSIQNREVASPRFALGDQLSHRGSSRRSCCCIESDDHRESTIPVAVRKVSWLRCSIPITH